MKAEKDFAELIFAQRCPKDASVGEIANLACTTWRDINGVLSPIIGNHGVIALITRSIHLQQVNYPALKAIKCFLHGEFPALHAVLVKETSANAVLINNALLNTFHELLANLIGRQLTHQLLHSIFTTSPNGDSVQDTLS